MSAHRLSFLKECLTLRRVLLFVAGGILLTRLFTALVTPGYTYDRNAFALWGMRMAQLPASQFYAEGYFADYPPGYLWVLKLVGHLLLGLNLELEAPLTGFLLAVPVALAEAALGCLLVWLAWPAGKKAGLAMAAWAMVNPTLWFDTGVWKQIDGVLALALVGCFVLLARKKWLWAAFAYGLALAVKPQALILGPVLAAAFLLPCLDKKQRLAQLGRTAAGAGIALLTVYLPAVPFWGWGQAPARLLEKYLTTAAGYPYATVNAAGLPALLGANWTPWEQNFGPLSWKVWGMLAIAALTVWAGLLAWKSARRGSFCPVLLAAVYSTGVFALAHAMHERYMVVAAILVLAAAAIHRDRRLLAIGAGLCVTSAANQMLVYFALDTQYQFLTEGWPALLLRLDSAATVVLFGLLALRAWQLLAGKESVPAPRKQPEKKPAAAPHAANKGRRRARREQQAALRSSASSLSKPSESSGPVVPLLSQKQPPFTRREILALLGAAVALAVFSFVYLGDLTAPQTALDCLGGQSVTFTVTAEDQPGQLWVYPGIGHSGGRLTVTGPAGDTVVDMALDEGGCFQWTSHPVSGAGEYTVTLSNGQLLELAFKDNQGNVLPAVSEQSAVCDEPDGVPEVISQLNSMYFDEIYHGRTGYEFVHKLSVYETTHPPLGKDFIALGILIFGMTGFGWRFFGTLCGGLMLPVLYLLVRRLSRSRGIAAFAGALLAFDFMRYSQSRIATIDSYVVLFILLSGLCMVWYCQSVLEKGVCRSVLPMALGGVAFGLGAAAKWTGLYAGVGLAILYFAVLWLRRRQKQPGFGREVTVALAGGVAFYVVVPFAIYLASYLPYWLRDPGFDLSAWWQCQVTMFNYHTTLEATHPYQSAWYTWPVDWRPVWYYYRSENGLYASISGMINPLVCWLSTAAVIYTGVQAVRRKASAAQLAALLLYFTQLLPWVLVERCTFLYHYFPSLVFAIALLALAVEQLTRDRPILRRRVCLGVCAGAALLLVWFYPALSGLPVGEGWARSLKWFSSWLLYPI